MFAKLTISPSITLQYKRFLKQCSKALRLDTTTAEVISGEFAAEAILTRAEHLAQQEVSGWR